MYSGPAPPPDKCVVSTCADVEVPSSQSVAQVGPVFFLHVIKIVHDSVIQKKINLIFPL
jgi:hypothetical protein